MSLIFGYTRNIVRGLLTPLESVVRNKSLYWMLVQRDLLNRTSGTVLGKVWPFVQPAMQILGYWFLFGVIFFINLSLLADIKYTIFPLFPGRLKIDNAAI